MLFFLDKSQPNVNKEFESFLEFNSKHDLELLNSEDNTNKSLQINSKVKFIKRNSDKTKKNILEKNKDKKEINHNIEIKNNLSEICCSNKVNENCLIF